MLKEKKRNFQRWPRWEQNPRQWFAFGTTSLYVCHKGFFVRKREIFTIINFLIHGFCDASLHPLCVVVLNENDFETHIKWLVMFS